MAAHCGKNDGWHDERGYGGGHYGGDGVTWCSGRQPEQLYTMEQAVILGRRVLCESSDEGHSIERKGGAAVRHADGTVVPLGYGCANCDARIEVSYPPLVPARRGA